MTNKTPITPEERAFMRANCERKLPHDMAKFGRPDPDDMRILRLLTALEAAEAESARLRAERDWLAGSMAEDGCPYLAFWADLEEDMRPDWCICTDTADDGFDCTGDPKECWQQEAACRAVTAGEV